ncbi:MAG TPA: hypothetical protein DCX07_07400 [Phycisphaerales bacterium]|nr:hypothetical protein [Phycisphaerales bacterium]
MAKHHVMSIVWLIGVGILVFPYLGTMELPQHIHEYTVLTLAGYGILGVWAVVVGILGLSGRTVLTEGIIAFLLTILSTPGAGRRIPETLPCNETALAILLHAVSVIILLGPMRSIFQKPRQGMK